MAALNPLITETNTNMCADETCFARDPIETEKNEGLFWGHKISTAETDFLSFW